MFSASGRTRKPGAWWNGSCGQFGRELQGEGLLNSACHSSRDSISEKSRNAVLIEPEYLTGMENQNAREVVAMQWLRKACIYETADGVAHLGGIDRGTLRDASSALPEVASATSLKPS